MKHVTNRFILSMLFILIIFILQTIKTTIDNRHTETLASYTPAATITKSPQFSPEELTKEIPDGLTWMLIDKDGYAFDWEAFCEQHTNCKEAFHAKGIPTPQFTENGPSPESIDEYYDRMAEELWKRYGNQIEDDSQWISCTTDADCYAKHGHDMHGNP